MGGLDQYLSGPAVEQGQGPAGHAHLLGQGLEEGLGYMAEVEVAVKGLSNAIEQGQLFEAARRWSVGSFGHKHSSGTSQK